MKQPLSVSLIVLISIVSFLWLSSCDQHAATDSITENATVKPKEMVYDSIRADKLGADQYGMKKYIMVLLKKGPNQNLTEQESANVQTMHMANIRKMAEKGILAVSGPFTGDGDLRGIFVLNVETVEEAEHMLSFDQAVKEGVLVMELYEWYGSAALMEVNEIHNQIAKVKI